MKTSRCPQCFRDVNCFGAASASVNIGALCGVCSMKIRPVVPAWTRFRDMMADQFDLDYPDERAGLVA